MPIPLSYTETKLALLIHTMLGKTAAILGLTPEDYGEVIIDTLLAYGQSDISQITGMENIARLRALARVKAWSFIVDNFTSLYNFSADGASYDRSQLFNQAKQSLELAKTAALVYDTAYQARVVRTDPVHDPYRYRSEENSES